MGNNLKGRKIAILIESDYYEPEIHYYQHRFAEEGAEVHFVSRLWGNSKLTFLGHEARMPFECTESFETIDDEELATYAAVIVPSGMVSDRLRYTEDVAKLPPNNMGAVYVNEDVVVDGDLVTARTGAHCHLLAGKIIELLTARTPVGAA